MGHDRIPEFEEHWRAFDELIEYTRGLVGDLGTEELGYVDHGQIGVYDVTPHNHRASGINIIAEQWLVVSVGGFGGRWNSTTRTNTASWLAGSSRRQWPEESRSVAPSADHGSR